MSLPLNQQMALRKTTRGRRKNAYWTIPEDEIVEAMDVPGVISQQIVQALLAAGYERTREAVAVRRQKLRACRAEEAKRKERQLVELALHRRWV